MTATDQSFIRAYSDTSLKEPRSAASGCPHQVSHGDDEVNHTKMSEQPLSTSDVREPQEVEIGSTERHELVSNRRVDPSDAVIPPRPHFNPSAFGRPEARKDQHQQPAESSGEIMPEETLAGTPRETTEKSPSTATTDRLAFAGTSSRLFDDFQSQWEVDRFVWPTVCDALIRGSHQNLSDILRRLTRLSTQGQKVFAITSCSAGEGGSTLALCLARLAAAEGQRAALLDGNLDAPTIGRNLGISFSSGWQDYASQLPVSETAVYSIDDQLSVLPVSCMENEIDQRTRDRGLEVVGTLSQAYDLVLIDAGPMFVAARQWFYATVHDCIDGALIVRDMRHTVAQQVDDVCFRINQCGIDELAVIENFQSECFDKTQKQTRTVGTAQCMR